MSKKNIVNVTEEMATLAIKPSLLDSLLFLIPVSNRVKCTLKID